MTRFKVFYSATNGGPRIVLGIATMTFKGVRQFTPSLNPQAQDWLEGKETAFLADFRSEVYRLVKSVGHDGKFFSSWDENTGIGVDRI